MKRLRDAVLLNVLAGHAYHFLVLLARVYVIRRDRRMLRRARANVRARR